MQPQAPSYFDYNAFQTFMFDLDYQVTQVGTVELANGETVAAGGTYASSSVTNLTVDDFQAAEVTNEARKTIRTAIMTRSAPLARMPTASTRS